MNYKTKEKITDKKIKELLAARKGKIAPGIPAAKHLDIAIGNLVIILEALKKSDSTKIKNIKLCVLPCDFALDQLRRCRNALYGADSK